MYKYDLAHIEVFRYQRARAASSLARVLAISESADWWQDDQFRVYRMLAQALIESENAIQAQLRDDPEWMP